MTQSPYLLWQLYFAIKMVFGEDLSLKNILYTQVAVDTNIVVFRPSEPRQYSINIFTQVYTLVHTHTHKHHSLYTRWTLQISRHNDVRILIEIHRVAEYVIRSSERITNAIENYIVTSEYNSIQQFEIHHRNQYRRRKANKKVK